MKWNISVIRGKNTNKYFVSTGEGMRINKNFYIFRPKKYKLIIRKLLSIITEGYNPVLLNIYIFMSKTRVKLFEYSKSIC